MGTPLQLTQAEPMRAKAQHQIEQSSLAQGAPQPKRRSENSSSPPTAVTPKLSRQVEHDLKVPAHLSRHREERLHVTGGVTYRECIEHEIVVVALEAKASGEDHIRMAGGLVAIQVDREHVLEPGERALQASSVRGGEHRVSGEGNQRSDLPLAGRFDLFGQRGSRQLAAKLRQPSHPAAPRAKVTAVTSSLRQRHEIRRRGGEHEPALPVEVSGNCVQSDDQPGGEAAEFLGAGANPSISYRRGRSREGARERPDLPSGNASSALDALGRKSAGRSLQSIQSVDRTRQVPQL